MWFGKDIKNLKFWDLQLIKVAVFFFTLFVASFINAELLVRYRIIWLALFVVSAIKPFIKIIGRKK